MINFLFIKIKGFIIIGGLRQYLFFCCFIFLNFDINFFSLFYFIEIKFRYFFIILVLNIGIKCIKYNLIGMYFDFLLLLIYDIIVK